MHHPQGDPREFFAFVAIFVLVLAAIFGHPSWGDHRKLQKRVITLEAKMDTILGLAKRQPLPVPQQLHED